MTDRDPNRLFFPYPAVEPRKVAYARAETTGCPWRDYKDPLRAANLRPTRQRMALGWLLFSKGGRHVTADMLHEEALRARIRVSLATVYNTLNQFTAAGLLRQIGVDGTKSYFDTDPSAHGHFFVEGEDGLIDIPADAIVLDKLPEVPEGFEIARVDVVVRLRRKVG
jgi:Fur family iron response transcriptional regulator